MDNVMFWGAIEQIFGYRNVVTKAGDTRIADLVIPVGNDILLIDENTMELEIPADINIRNLHEQKSAEAYKELKEKWSQYYSCTITAANRQLREAEQLVRNNVTMKTHNEVLPVGYSEGDRVHKIILLKGADTAARQYFITGYGGLLLNSSLKEDDKGVVRVNFSTKSALQDNKMLEDIVLFSFGNLGENVHVFTELQFEFLSLYLPTMQAVIDYLNWKEAFLKATEVVYTDEYTILLTYLQRSWGTNNQKIKAQQLFVGPYDDKTIVEFQNSELGKSLIQNAKTMEEIFQHLEESVGASVSTAGLKFNLITHYLSLSLEQLLSISRQLPELKNMDYKDANSKTFAVHGNDRLYLFHNTDKKIADDKVRTAYGMHLTGKLALEYIREGTEKGKIEHIITCVMHRDKDDNVYTTFLAINLGEVASNKDLIKVLEDTVEVGKSMNWIPDELNLKELLKDMEVSKRSENLVEKYKGVGRNDSCPCGSGKKFKKCCGNNVI